MTSLPISRHGEAAPQLSKVQREINTPVQLTVPTVQNPFTYAATFHPLEHPLLGIDDSLAFNGRVCYYVSAVAGEST